ncbi:hypothetical protein [Emticicia fontis]
MKKIDDEYRFFVIRGAILAYCAFLLPSSTTNKGDLLMTNTTETTEKRLPTHLIYITSPKAGSNESSWLKVGAAWKHKENDGFTLSIEHPLSPNGQYVMLKNDVKSD